MSFYYQLRMLIWKNLRIRRQQKMRCIVELVWPIILFLILMWVRFRGLRTDIHECHFVQKAMPTAGALPFLQSFICSFNNTCHKFEKNAEVKDKLNTSLLFNILEEYRNMPRNQNITEIQRTLSDIKKLYGLIGTINSRKKFNGSIKIPKFIKNPDSIREELKRRKLPLSSHSIDALLSSEVALINIIEERFSPKYFGNVSLLLCNQTLMKNLLVNIQSDKLLYSELCSMTEKDFDSLISIVAKEADPNDVIKQVGSMFESSAYESLSMEQLFEVVRLSNNINNNIKNLQLYVNAMGNVADITERYRNMTFGLRGKSTRWYEEIMTMVDLVLCGRNNTAEEDHDVSFQPGGNVTRFDSLNDQLKGRIELLYEYDPSLSQKCNSIFQIFEESPFLKTVWRIYKPFVRGKILYSPKTNATERIMNNINSTFQWIEKSITILHEINQYISLAKEVFLDNAVALETVKQFIRSDVGLKLMNNSLLKSAFVNDSENEVEGKKDKIEDIQDTIERQLGDENTYRRTKLFANIQDILDNVTSFLECVDLDKVHPYQSEEDAVTAGMDLLETNKLLAVIVFENQTNDTLSPFVTYKIRMNSERIDNTQFIHDALRQPGPRMRPFIDLKYITFGFAYLQDLLEHYIIMEHTGLNRSNLPGIYLQQFPYPCYIDDQFVMAISRSFPLFMVLSWVYTSAMIVKSIVYEKEQRLKETMRVMGLGNCVHWVGWFIDSLIPMLLTIFLLTIILVYGKILSNAQPSLVYCFLLLYCMATIAQSFLISVFFSRANIAAASGGLIFFVLYLPYRFMVRWMLYLSPTSKVLMCLSSNVAFGLGASYFSLYEESGTGLNWGVVRESPLFADEFSLFYVMIMLAVDCVLYLILTWYIESVAPGQFGVPKPWYFPVMLSYWCGNKYKKKRKGSLIERNGFVSKDNCEEEPTRLKVGISIHNLSMIYPNGKVAVKNFSLNFYEDQITSFLGHNGAGKTTTISILTGIYAPTSGTAYINGFDIRTNMDNIRNSLGMCPQHNVLFNLMSVEDHLYFYSMLRGKLRKKDVQNEVDQMIEDLQLPHKRTSLAKDLSGGMQRKLSVAIAFIGGSKVVILDEPTSGVDPYSRRSIWELLMKYKRGRTVVLTTHYMDEADMLGDRIAIIANGRLQCCGSSLFLKNRFGRGYYLTIDLKQNGSPIYVKTVLLQKSNLDGTCRSSLVCEEDSLEMDNFHDIFSEEIVSADSEPLFIQKVHEHVSLIIPSAAFLEKIGSELIFILPQRNNLVELKELFRSLELNKSALHIDSYGMSDTSLEEIFLRVADNAEPVADNPEQGDNKAGNTVSDSISKICSGSNFKKLFRSKTKMEKRTALVNDIQEAEPEIVDDKIIQLNGSVVKYSSVPISDDRELLKYHSKGSWKQFKALHIKRYHHTKRKKKALFSELVLPGLFVCLTLIMTSILPKFGGRPPLILKPSIYGDNLYIFNSIDEANETWAQKYSKNLTGSQGLGMICSKNYEKYRYNDDDEKPCYEEIKFTNGSTNISSFGPDCSCSTGSQICPVESGFPIPPYVELASRETMFDLSGSNISDWILKTWKTHERNRKRKVYCFKFLKYNPLDVFNFKYNKTMCDEKFKKYASSDFQRIRLGGYNIGFTSPFPETSIQDLIQFVVRNGSNIDDFYNSTTYKRNNIKVWFNNKAWAASVAYLNAINNVVLRSSLPPDKMDSASLYGIRAINHPMNFTKKQKEIEIIKESGISLLHAISVLFALSFVPASFTLYLIEERVSNSKHLQLVSGLKRHMYWFQAYTWDMSCYILSALLIIIIFLLFNEQAYISSRNFLAFICLLFFYGYSCIPLMYPATYFFKIPSSAFVGLACGNMFIGLVTTLTTFVLSIFYDEELSSVNNVLKEVFLIFPHFCLGDGLMKLATNHFSYYQFQSLDIEIKNEIFKWDSIGKNLFWMFFSGNMFFCFALIIEYKLIKKLFCFKTSTIIVDTNNPNEDDDVKNEKNRVLYGDTSCDILKINCLTKVYNSITGTNVAVNQVCIGIKRGECFGLLGLNGAGKTTTFKMLTGALKPTSGDAFVNNHSIIKEKTTAQSSIGYCPQFDALDSQLTPREHLEFYAHLRDIPRKQIPSVVERCLKRLDLDRYADRCSGTLSGGNKRKLSTAIAILGNPPLIFLDEPTSGMDPRARRFLWTCIQSLIHDGHSVILTSHSMEECQALCTKLTIMVNGTFRCLGSSQHLKSKFGGGYCLSIRCMEGESNVQLVKDYMTSHLDQAVLIEEHHTHLRYQIPQGSHQLPAVLEAVEEAHENKIVIDYSLSQTTLEDVFLQFAQEQTERGTVKGKLHLKSVCCLPCSRCCRGDSQP